MSEHAAASSLSSDVSCATGASALGAGSGAAAAAANAPTAGTPNRDGTTIPAGDVASSSGLVGDLGQDAPRWRRVLLKLSGEAFAGGGELGIHPATVATIARQIAAVVRSGVQVAVVVGGGNYFRGSQLSDSGMARPRADYMGMLGTVINCLALQDFLEREGVVTRVQTAIAMGQVAEPYLPLRAIRHLEKGRVVIFGAGLGAPFFSTDTAGAQRALEIGAQALLMAKRVDGVYDDDPRRNRDAVKFDGLSYAEVLARGLKVADATAISLCMDNRLPIVVFDLLTDGNISRAVRGEKIGTLVSADGDSTEGRR